MCRNIRKSAICGLVPAAGMSVRMREFKPLMILNGKTIIENTVDSLFEGGAEKVVVVAGYRGEELEKILRTQYGEKIIIAWNREFAVTDMLHSIQIGCRALPPCEAFFLLPGDMPVVQQSTFRKLLESRRFQAVPGILFPELDGHRKHPPLIDREIVPEILAFDGGGGLRKLWEIHRELIHTVPVNDRGVWMDLDTRENYHLCRSIYEVQQEGLPLWK